MEREFCELFDDVDDSPSSLEEDELYDDVCFLCSEQRRDFSVISLLRVSTRSVGRPGSR